MYLGVQENAIPPPPALQVNISDAEKKEIVLAKI